MQWFAFLWFQLQVTKQHLQDKASGLAQSPADSANLNTPTSAPRLEDIPQARTTDRVGHETPRYRFPRVKICLG